MTLEESLAQLCIAAPIWRISNPRTLARTNEGVVCAAPAMAKSAAGVGPAGGTE